MITSAAAAGCGTARACGWKTCQGRHFLRESPPRTQHSLKARTEKRLKTVEAWNWWPTWTRTLGTVAVMEEQWAEAKCGGLGDQARNQLLGRQLLEHGLPQQMLAEGSLELL